MGRLQEWMEEKFVGQPDRPSEPALSLIMGLTHKNFNEMDIWKVEEAIFVLSSWLYYISYQLGTLEGRGNAMDNQLKGEITLAAQRIKSGYFDERFQLAKASDPKFRERSMEVFEIKAKAGTLKELKFSIKDKIDVLKMTYYRRRKQ